MIISVFLWSLSLVTCQYLGTGDYQYVGCFRDNHRDRDLGTRALDLPRVNVSTCVTWCREHYYKYAGLQQAGAGASCWCGPEFGKHGPGSCDDTCPGDTEHTCGGEESNSVYRTGVRVPGPPGSVKVTRMMEDSLTVSWAAPESPNGAVTNYRVVISPGESFNKHRARVTDKVINMDGADRIARVGDLLSGTQYTVTVSAVNRAGEAGPGLDTQAWTKVGVPDTPSPPEVLKWDKRGGVIRVRVSPVENNGGEVRHYQVIVAEGQHPSLNNVPLLGYKDAEAEGHGYWISAQITPQYLESRHGELSLGDGQLYGGYLNHGPLDSAMGYQLAVAVTQSLHGESRVSVSDLVTSDPGAGDSLVLRVSGDSYRLDTRQPVSGQHSPASPRVNIGLVAGCVVGGVLLAGAVIVFLVLRRRAGPGSPLRRARSDTLALSQQQQQHNSSGLTTAAVGVTAASYVHDNEEILASETPDLNNIKAKVWMIPKNFVELSGEILGKGRFGSVTKGQVHSNGRVIWVNTQHVYLSSLTRGDTSELTRALSASAQAGSHPNITGLVGLCEEQEVLTVVMDQAQPSLKQHLLDSRALVTAPEYAATHARYSTAREEAILELLTGLADGLRHLGERGIHLGSLCASNIFMCTERSAKISGFGMSDWHRSGQSLDMTRWLAPETLMKKMTGVKSDVWSLGCVLWETVCLGATLYPHVPAQDVMTRVMRGLRAPHPLGASDALFQLMLNCWMLDPYERPGPGEVCDYLRELSPVCSQHLSFVLPTSDFAYEVYEPGLEVLTGNIDGSYDV